MEQRSDLRVMRDALPDEHRAVLMLVTVESQSYQKAAPALGIPMGTLMSRQARASVRLFEADYAPLVQALADISELVRRNFDPVLLNPRGRPGAERGGRAGPAGAPLGTTALRHPGGGDRRRYDGRPRSPCRCAQPREL